MSDYDILQLRTLYWTIDRTNYNEKKCYSTFLNSYYADLPRNQHKVSFQKKKLLWDVI